MGIGQGVLGKVRGLGLGRWCSSRRRSLHSALALGARLRLARGCVSGFGSELDWKSLATDWHLGSGQNRGFSC